MMNDREIVSGESEFSSSHVDRKASGRPRRWTRATAGFFGLAFIVVLIDQVSKYWIETTLAEGEYVPVVGDVFGLRLIYNPGAAFSFGTGATWALSLLATVVVIVVIRVAPRIKSRAWLWALALLLGGAVGNLVDRFFKDPGFPSGHVVDFLDYGIFIGNIADIAIVFAAVLMVFLGIRGHSLEGVDSQAAASDGGELGED